MAIAFGLISYAMILSTVEQYEVGRAVATSRGGAAAVVVKNETPLIFYAIMVFKIMAVGVFIAIFIGWIFKFLGLKIKFDF
ncbi:hypothetical protein I6J77_15130 [Rhodanobacter sp. FDAARGOS 1247]|uniref:hypothetical protein n=1 Tax=Rhodanobacter sp. FDAARGOS 1247 TaxID=2778082 RepID=UPI00194F99D7|nr:hypothetical protein [Rhodanobacter sp. FDAARGOS 1247]QRP63425.1 hypothetical protein I6J77_15130 [Rhodanobacter sp. FDAARGOS 1247]